MLETGIKVRHWQIRNKPGDLIAEFDLDLLADETPYPYRLHLEQHRLTPIQLDILRAEGGAEIHFGHRVTGFTQNADGVSVTVESDDGARTIEASWLIGADGGRSVVRKETRRRIRRLHLAGDFRRRQHALRLRRARLCPQYLHRRSGGIRRHVQAARRRPARAVAAGLSGQSGRKRRGAAGARARRSRLAALCRQARAL